jgi:fido (protein-threonine AMPylation protein)
MSKLISNTNGDINDANHESVDKHPLTIATRFHLNFLNEIHPFADGNGRIGRIFMNLIIMKAGFPPIFIKEVDRSAYMTSFENPDPSVMLDFMADRLLESMKVKLDFVQTQKSAK